MRALEPHSAADRGSRGPRSRQARRGSVTLPGCSGLRSPAGCGSGRPVPVRRPACGPGGARGSICSRSSTTISPISANACGIPPARCPENTRPSSRRAGWSAGHRLLRPHVDGGEEPAVADPVQQRVEVDDRGPADQDEAGAGRDQVELAGAEQVLALGRGRWRARTGTGSSRIVSSSAAGWTPCSPQHGVGQPRVVHPDVGVEGQRAAGAARGRGCRSRAGRRSSRAAAPRPRCRRRRTARCRRGRRGPRRLMPRARSRARPSDMLGDRLGVGGAAAQHVDALLDAGLVVDVGEEVALDVEIARRLRARSQPRPIEVGLADDRERVGRTSSSASGRSSPSRSTTVKCSLSAARTSGVKMRSVVCGSGLRMTVGRVGVLVIGAPGDGVKGRGRRLGPRFRALPRARLPWRRSRGRRVPDRRYRPRAGVPRHGPGASPTQRRPAS